MKTYRDLLVWQKSMDLVTRVYEVTQGFPGQEIYGLMAQIRRAAVSIPSNIAEGYARNSDADFVRFLRIACGSLYEMNTQLEIAVNLRYVGKGKAESLAESAMEIEKMLSANCGLLVPTCRLFCRLARC